MTAPSGALLDTWNSACTMYVAALPRYPRCIVVISCRLDTGVIVDLWLSYTKVPN